MALKNIIKICDEFPTLIKGEAFFIHTISLSIHEKSQSVIWKAVE